METPDSIEAVLDSFGGNFDRIETVVVSFGEVVRLFRWGVLSSKEESTTVSIDANVLTETVADAIGGVAEAIGEVDDCFARRK